MANDDGHTVERCHSGISASQALAVTSGERAHWERMERYWQTQLGFAEKRELAASDDTMDRIRR